MMLSPYIPSSSSFAGLPDVLRAGVQHGERAAVFHSERAAVLDGERAAVLADLRAGVHHGQRATVQHCRGGGESGLKNCSKRRHTWFLSQTRAKLRDFCRAIAWKSM